MLHALSGLILLIPEKPDGERDSVAEGWDRSGGSVLRLGRFWEPPDLDRRAIRIYGNETFGLVLAQKLDLQLHSPSDELLTELPNGLLQRSVRGVPMTGILDITFPAFVKSVVPKQIPSRVYATAEELRSQCIGLKQDMRFLVSQPVEFESEVRCFVLEGQVLAASAYEGSADVGQASNFAASVAHNLSQSHPIVIDVGRLRNGSWAVVEFNAAWGSGLNGCDPDRILPAIEAATFIL